MRPSLPLSKKVYVVWPPVWNAFDPHVAVPAICSYLAEQGLQVRQFDLNIDFFRYLIAEENIERETQERTTPLPEDIRSAVTFARTYYHHLKQPLPQGCQQRFSEDAEQQLLSQALALFNYSHPETVFSTLAVYHAGDVEDSDFIAEFAASEAGNPFVDFYRSAFLKEVAKDLPAIVGISVCGSFQLGAAFTLARLVKDVDPRIRVVMGGAFFSTMPQVLLGAKTAANLFRHVDAFILNEGEIPFLRLARDVFSGSPPLPAPNVVLRGERELRYEPGLCLPAHDIAVPKYPDRAVEKYFRPIPRIPIEVSRGCYWAKCTFCNLATGANERYRGIPIENIVRSVKTLTLRYRSSSVFFSTLAMAPNILRGVASRLISEQIKISWTAWIRPEKSLTRNDFQMFKQSGCSSLAVTPESFNDRTLSRMEKGVKREHLIRIMRDLTEAGLCGWINLIPGFPGETAEDFLSTLEICQGLGLRGEFFPFSLLKNSPVYKQPERFGVTLQEGSRKDLAVRVPFVYCDNSASSGLELIQIAARHFPEHVFSDDPLSGYTFDFSRAGSPLAYGNIIARN